MSATDKPASEAWNFWQTLEVLNQRYSQQPPEEILFPSLAIIDAHHHLYDRADLPGQRYLFDDFLADLDCGHNIIATVFAECSTMWRVGGDEAMRPIGEIEFANGVAAMSESGRYGPVRVIAGIVGFADLRLGDGVDRVLDAYEARAGGRVRGIRNRAQYEPRIGDTGTLVPSRDLMKNPAFRQGLKRLAARGIAMIVSLPSADPGLSRPRARRARSNHGGLPLQRATGRGALYRLPG